MKTGLPLTTRILLLAIGNVLLLSLIFAVFLRLQLRQEFGRFLMDSGRDRTRAISQQMANQLEGLDKSQWTAVLKRYSADNGVTFTIFEWNGRQIAGPSLALPPEVQTRLQPRQTPRRGVPFIPPFIVIADAAVPYWLGVWMPVGQSFVTQEQPSRTILVLSSATLISNPYFFNPKPWLLILAIAVGVTLLYWLPLVRGLTRAINQMMHDTAEIADGHFDTQVSSRRTDELGRLSVSIQQVAARLDTFTRGHKRFLGDVAHELRSPLARIQVALAILERRGTVDGEVALRDLKEDADLMAALTDELLAFARAELIPEVRSLQPVALVDVAHRAAKLEGRDRIPIRVAIDPSIQVRADPQYLFRSLANLLRNAVRYAGKSGEIVVTAETCGRHVAISVIDSGPGVPEEALQKIFTPFYRLEESRDRRSGGTGLGLAIVRSCVEACQGSVECHNRTPAGFQVTITLQAA